MGRIHYAPMRNVKILQDGSFEESAHPSFCGSLDMEAVMKAYYDIGYTGYMSPAHGRMIWNEEGNPATACMTGRWELFILSVYGKP